MTSPTENGATSLRLGDSDAWSASTKRASTPINTLDSKKLSTYTLSFDEKSMCKFSEEACTTNANAWTVGDNDSEEALTQATAVTVRPVTPEDIQKPNMIVDVEARGEEKASIPEEWTPTKNEWLIMISLAFISLMVALDATILVTVLPVSLITEHKQNSSTDLNPPGDSTKAERNIGRGLLGWYIVPSHLRHLPANHCLN
jgi:hypothetical protein